MAEEKFGTWGTLRFETPDVLEDARSKINDIGESLVAVMDVALAALNFAKTYTTAYVDPLQFTVDALIEELRKQEADLRKAGIYITGDYGLLDWPFEDLKGGFGSYENRMVARLSDRSDPTRPDFSSGTTLFAAFLYTSADPSAVQETIGFCQQIAKVFNVRLRQDSGPPVPVITGVEYGNEAGGIIGSLTEGLFSGQNPPDIADVTWKAAPPTNIGAGIPVPTLGPGGFLVTVSTLPDGIPLAFDRPKNNAGTQKRPETGKQVQPRERGLVRDTSGAPITLHGGADMVGIDKWRFGFNDAVDGSGNLKNGYARVYGLPSRASQAPIPLELLKSGDTYFFQKTFYVSLADVAPSWVSGETSITLKLSDLPHHAEAKISNGKVTLVDKGKPATYYVRVASTTSEVGGQDKNFRYDFAQPTWAGRNATAGRPFTVPVEDKLEPSAVGEWSQPATLTFPRSHTDDYLKTVKAALLVLILSRPDLPVVDELITKLGADKVQELREHKEFQPNVALLRTGLEPYKHLLNLVFSDPQAEQKKSGGTPPSWRADLWRTLERVAKDLYDKTGPLPAQEKTIVEASKALRETTVAELLTASGEVEAVNQMAEKSRFKTLLDLIDPSELGSNWDFGLARNMHSLGLPSSEQDQLLWVKGVVRGRKPQFIEVEIGDTIFPAEIAASEVEDKLKKLPPGVQSFYEKFVQEDGSIKVNYEGTKYLRALENRGGAKGSGDDSPVFYHHHEGLRVIHPTLPLDDESEQGVVFARTLLANYQEGMLFQQAAIALQVLASTYLRSSADGEWIAIRFFDAFPQLEGFFDAFSNFLQSLDTSFSSTADGLVAYIEFLEGRIAEMQQFIRRIESLISALLAMAIDLPQCSALLLQSDGTDALMTDLIQADNKPSDSPLSYGAGIAIVANGAPAFLTDLMKVDQGKPVAGGQTPQTGITGGFDTGNLPAPTAPDPNAAPEVL